MPLVEADGAARQGVEVEEVAPPEEEVRGRPPELLVDRPTSRGLATGTHG